MKDRKVDFDALVREALDLKSAVEASGIEAAEAYLAEELKRVSQSHDLEAYFGDDECMGFSIRGLDPRAFFKAFQKRFHANICGEGSPLRAEVSAHTAASVTMILALLQERLSLPPEMAPLLVPIAVMIAQSGMDAFCDMTGAG